MNAIILDANIKINTTDDNNFINSKIIFILKR